jgi:xanthine dehydrogenase accessory factor
MSIELEFWQKVKVALDENEPCTLICVVDHSGSVPGVTGVKAVVTTNALVGTIGGGAAENLMVSKARGMGSHPQIAVFHHEPDADGTLCCGVQHFALVPLGEKHKTTIDSIVDALSQGKHGVLSLNQERVHFKVDDRIQQHFDQDESSWEYQETLGLLDSVTIIGGGHVSLALCRILATLPVRIIVLDNRQNVPTMQDNRWAHVKRTVDYAELNDHVPRGRRSFAVIMTHGHEHDFEALTQLVHHDLRYLGMLGSKHKVATIMMQLRDNGLPDEKLNAVHAPVGLPIQSHTPEEIAISIAAEIVSVRNGAS